ncbi:MAG: hypothetical protein KDM63_17335, partial [Verrucomicrobiae bacterium]|nr:hypothetical protein [Verrucomicrobiae bacterium]
MTFSFLDRIRSLPLCQSIARRLRPIARSFDGPRHHRFEWVFMRILFAFVVYQSMPLGTPFSDAFKPNPALDTALRRPMQPIMSLAPVSETESDRTVAFLLPLSQLLPNSEAAITYTKQDKANGLAHLIDLTFFSDPGFIKVLPWIVIPCLLLYASGIGLPVVLPILAFISIGSRTLYNSQGYIHHGYQMLSLILLAQTIVVWWHVIRGDWRAAFGLRKPELRNGRTLWDWTIRYSQWMIVICYVIAGVIKPIRSDGEWFQNSHYIGVQVVKTHRQNYYSALDERWNIPEPRIATLMLKEHPNLVRIFLSCGVMLEIFAFLALYNRFLSLAIVFALVSFHVFNDLMMGLYFYGNE